ncbi:butyrophilin-like protein 8 [Polypterus senegalus]|uniref:butyrophilin-like protein 8 n=1 Tax=Polypterus senegalus TaxID=55291 RepID=UPI001965B91A|nr:butyrophilin-like protein 8 [Polypterus senegalus]
MTIIIVHSLLMLQALSVTQGFSVFGSDEPLVAALGEDIILPCNVDTPVPLEELELEWIKKDTSSLVHLSIAGEDQPESQHKSYRNRTQIFHENLLIGDYSLKLKKTEVQDEGKYRCVVHSRTQSEEVVVELKSVERLFVTGTNGPLFVYAGGEIVLNCFVDTHIPIEKLEVQWVKTEDGSETLVHLFVEGEDQPESQNQLYKGRTELSNESLADGNFSLKLKSVGIKDKGIYKCKVHTNTESAETTIELDVGPSVLHIFLYVFSIGSLLIGLGTVIQAGCYLFSKTQSKMGYYCFYVNISIPNVLLAFAFVLWGILEAGNWTETVTCIATNLLRVLVLFLIVSDKLRVLELCQGICFQRLISAVFGINIIIIETVMTARVDCLSGCETACQLLRLSPDLLSYVHFQVLHAPCIGLFKMLHHHSRLTRYSGSCGIDEVMDSLILIDEGAGNVINLYF